MPNSHYSPDFCFHLIEEMEKGKSLVEVCADNNIARKTLSNWLSDSAPKYDQLRDAVEVGHTKYEAYMVSLGKRGVLGKIDNFKEGTWKSIMANHFDWSDKKDIKQNNTMERSLTDEELEAKLKALGYKKVEE